MKMIQISKNTMVIKAVDVVGCGDVSTKRETRKLDFYDDFFLLLHCIYFILMSLYSSSEMRVEIFMRVLS